jgi:hypothetical protein
VATSDVAIANLALTKIGDLRIISLSENTKPAREVNAVYSMLRDKLQRTYNWRFCVKRAVLAAESTAPVFDYSYQYPVPSDCLRILQINAYYPAPDLSDLISSGGQEYVLEGGKILTRSSGSMNLRYLARISDPTKFDTSFDEAFASSIAYNVAEALTQSDGKKNAALRDYRMALSEAIRANAIENPPESIADTTWLTVRL